MGAYQTRVAAAGAEHLGEGTTRPITRDETEYM